MTFYGEHSLSELTSFLDAGRHQSVLLVTGRSSYRVCGVAEMLAPVLDGREVRHVDDFETNPKKEDILRILEKKGDFDFSAIIAVGGGSVMDVAKLIKCFKDEPDQMRRVMLGADVANPAEVNLFAIPTTAGSGAEATHFAVVYDQGVKYSVAHVDLLPDAAWILPSVLATVPQNIAASAAMDAFSQGVESYWCIHSTPQSKEIAKRAIKLAWKHMLPAVLEQDAQSLEAMGQAAHLAGQAINITKTTAPHAISYALTTHFGIMHGHAVALTLPALFRFNDGVTSSDLLDARGVDYVRGVMGALCEMLACDDVREVSVMIGRRVEDLGLSMNLHDLGVKSEEDRERIIANGFNPQRVNNNPRRFEVEDLRRILDSMLGV